MDKEEVPGPDDENYRENLEKFRVDIVQSLDLERHYIFSYLRSNAILDEEDCEIILNSGAGRKQKAAKFLDVLACKGQTGYDHFVASLEVEHPHLYEKMTGKRPQKGLDPIESLQKFNGTLWSEGPAKKDMIDFDRQYLATQLEKTASNLQMLSYFHSKIVHEKNTLEKKVLETATNLEDRQQEVQDLREQLKTRGQSLPNSGKSAESSLTVQRYIQELMAENADKSNRIISLQQSLLDSVESAERDRVVHLDLQRRHEEVLQQLRDVTINYDWERRNSKKMSEKMRKQSDQIKMGGDLRREIFELKWKLSEMQEQRDEAKDELREFRNVTEALNAKFDTVRKEKDKAVEFQEECSSTVSELQQESIELQSKLQEAYLDLNDLKRKNMRLNQESRTLKDQRDVLLQEREIAISERNVSMKERDEALRLNQELRQSRDESVEAHIRINKLLHEDYNKLHEEMDVVRQELRMITEENERLSMKLRQFENAKNMEPFEEMENTEEKDQTFDEIGVQPLVTEESKEEDGESVPYEAFKPFPWKKTRSNTAILKSAYKRINESQCNEFSKHRSSLPAVLDSCQSKAFQAVIGTEVSTGRISRDEEEEKRKGRLPGGKENHEKLRIDVTAARALSRSSSPLSPIPDRSDTSSARSLTAIVPFISDLSLTLAMKSGSQDNLNQNGKDLCTPPMSEHLKSPEPKRMLNGKSVSPKVLYRVDQTSVFDFSLHKKLIKSKEAEPKKNVHTNTSGKKINVKVRSSTVDGVIDAKTSEDGGFSQDGKSPASKKKMNGNVGVPSLAPDFLNINLPKRRHSSADLVGLLLEEENSADV